MEDTYKPYPYIPSEAYLYFPKGKDVKYKDQRSFFDGNVEFDEDEKETVEKLKVYAQEHEYRLNSIWTDNMILRFLQANDFKMSKTLASIKDHTIWRETKLPVKPDEKLLNFLNSGFLYIHGRDHKFRPIIVFNIYQLDPKTHDINMVTDALTFWLQYVIDELMIPGQIEHWIFLINIKNIGISLLANQSIRKLFAYLQGNFKCRLYQIYLLNASPLIYTPWQIAKKFLDGDTTRKVEFYRNQTPTALFKHANLEQVEQQFGGTAPNCTQYWPPIIPSNNYFVSSDDAQALVSKEFYRSLSKKGSLKYTKVSRSLLLDEQTLSEGNSQEEEDSLMLKMKTSNARLTQSMTFPRKIFKENQTENRHSINNNQRRSSIKIVDQHSPNSEESLDEEETDYVEYMSEKSTFTQEKGQIKEFRVSFLLELEHH